MFLPELVSEKILDSIDRAFIRCNLKEVERLGRVKFNLEYNLIKRQCPLIPIAKEIRAKALLLRRKKELALRKSKKEIKQENDKKQFTAWAIMLMHK